MKIGKIIFLIGIAFIPFISRGSDNQPPETTEINSNTLDCLSKAELEEIRLFPIRSTIQNSFITCQTELKEKLDKLKLSDKQIFMVYLSILSQSMAPFGHSNSIELVDLLKDKTLDCDNYALLFGHFYKIFNDQGMSLRFIGYDGGAIGNHAQIFAEGKEGTILLDPTIGLVAKTTFNTLLRGYPLKESEFIRFRVHEDTNIDLFAKKVIDSISKGKYRPSDLLYFFTSIEDFIAFSKETSQLWEEKNWPLLIRKYPTPGSIALKKKLKRKNEFLFFSRI
jgi:hypothetical protein